MGRTRPLVWLLAAVIVIATSVLAAGCGDDGASGGGSPQSLLTKAAAKPIDSANVRLRAEADIPGFPILGSRLLVTANGPFAANGPDALPTFDWKATLRAGGQTFPADVSAVDGHIYVFFMGIAYEAGPELLEQLGIPTEAGSPAPTSLKQFGIDPSDWLTNSKVSDGDEIGGDSTRVVTGKVDKRAVLDDLLAIVDSKGGEQLAELSDENADRVANSVQKVDVEVNVDGDDYPRRVYAQLDFVVPKDVKNAAYRSGTVTFELVLEEVGDVEVDFEPPVDPDPLSSLLDFAGLIFGVEEPADLWEKP